MSIEQYESSLKNGWQAHRQAITALNKATSDNRVQVRGLMDRMVSAIALATNKETKIEWKEEVDVPKATYGMTYSITNEAQEYPWTATLSFRGDGWVRYAGANYRPVEMELLLQEVAKSAYHYFKAPERPRD